MELIGTGRASQVYALDAHRVLRRSAFDTEDEARVMAWARDFGYPVPEVFDAAAGDLVMERLHGPTLGAALFAGQVAPDRAGAVLLGLHERLHRIEAPPWLPLAAHDVDASGAAPARLLHLDLHPENVVLTEDGPFLVDWTNAAAGSGAFDIAVSWAILAGVDFAGIGLAPERVGDVRDGLLAALREATEESALAWAIGYREADANVEEAEVLRVRAELG